MSELYKWRCYAIKYGALEAEADDVISDALSYIYSRPELDWTERLLHVAIRGRAKNCARARSNTPIGKIEDLVPAQQRFLSEDEVMLVDERMEYEELYAQAVEDVRQSKEARYTELLTRVCDDPQASVVEVGRELGMLTNTASGVMRRIRLYLQEKEADYAKA